MILRHRRRRLVKPLPKLQMGRQALLFHASAYDETHATYTPDSLSGEPADSSCGSQRPAQLASVKIEVLRRVVVDLGQGHGGFEERVPPGRETHRQGKALGALTAQMPLQGSDNTIELGPHPPIVERQGGQP
jgi:hypothetical protein